MLPITNPLSSDFLGKLKEEIDQNKLSTQQALLKLIKQITPILPSLCREYAGGTRWRRRGFLGLGGVEQIKIEGYYLFQLFHNVFLTREGRLVYVREGYDCMYWGEGLHVYTPDSPEVAARIFEKIIVEICVIIDQQQSNYESKIRSEHLSRTKMSELLKNLG